MLITACRHPDDNHHVSCGWGHLGRPMCPALVTPCNLDPRVHLPPRSGVYCQLLGQAYLHLHPSHLHFDSVQSVELRSGLLSLAHPPPRLSHPRCVSLLGLSTPRAKMARPVHRPARTPGQTIHLDSDLSPGQIDPHLPISVHPRPYL